MMFSRQRQNELADALRWGFTVSGRSDSDVDLIRFLGT
jgi:hypothetical protein